MPRRALNLGLVATLLLTAWALWWPQGSSESETFVPAPDPERRVAGVASKAVPVISRPVSVPLSDVEPWPDSAVALEPAVRDPFWPSSPSAPANVAVTAPEPVVVAAPEPAAHQPSEPSLPAPPRYLGQLLSPNGERVVLLADGAETVRAWPGQRLPGGWVVAGVDAERVRLATPDGQPGPVVEVPRSLSGLEAAR